MARYRLSLAVGIVSALSFAPDLSSGVYAAGSLNPSSTTSSNIALFSETTGETPLMFVGDEREGGFGIRASVMQASGPFQLSRHRRVTVIGE